MLERYHRELLNFLTRQVKDRDTAIDLTQESYARVLSAQHAGTAVLDVRALLYRTARNLVIDQHRRTAVRHHDDLDSIPESQLPAAPRHLEPEAAFAARQGVDAYLATIEDLPPRCREAFVLYVFDELSHAQIARRMGISVSMVEKHVVRGMDACRLCQRRLSEEAGTAGPPHAAAFDGVARDLTHLPAQGVARLKAGLPRRTRRTAAVATAAIAFLMVGAGWLGWRHWQQQPTFEQVYATQRGQQASTRLPDADTDGSLLQLDTATRLEVRLYRDRREVRLTEGQAMFTVHADAQRPFQVEAGPARITVVGTRFSVRHTPSGMGAGQTVVSVEEGRVRVARADGGASAPAIELGAGQQLAVDARGALGQVEGVPATEIAPWRSGRISFDRTPLSQALAEFERYGNTGVVVRDPAVGALLVGGSYPLSQFRHFAETLPQVLPVRLVPRDGVLEVVIR